MDDAIFTEFLDDQETALNALASRIRARDADPAEIDPIARRLADAYLMCSEAQRQDIRRLIGTFAFAQTHMGIEPKRIQLKIDGVYFRLALIYESMKDLQPDGNAAVARLDVLCRAAEAAGFDPNPYLKEVAGISNSTPESAQGSMRSLLLQRIVVEDKVLCPRCEKPYAKKLPGCPQCAADPARLGTPGHQSELLEEPISGFTQEVELIQLPTRLVLGIMALSLAAWASFFLTIVLVVLACVYPVFYLTWPSWLCIAINLVIFGLIRYFRFGDLVKKYSSDGRWRIAISARQLLLFFLIVFAILFAVVGLIHLYHQLSH
jgi:hypothetical protein